MSASPKKAALVIPTTHWDRQWYWPFERFSVKLTELFSAVKQLWKSEPRYRFAADGQTVMVEDYLQIMPQDAPLFRKMGKAGRFTMGPLYVQSDLYCTGAEAFIRNMLIGTAIAREFDALQKVVYLPDTFGHTPCMPTLVRGFGYRHYVLMRGVPDEIPAQARFFRWRAPDGSDIVVFRLRDGYANAAGLGLHKGTGEIFDPKSSGIRPRYSHTMAVKQLNDAMHKQIDGQGEPYILLAGVDHQIPQPQLPLLVDECSTAKVNLQFSDWNDAAESIDSRNTKLQEYTGEIHGTGASSVLGGTISTRIYLKQSNTLAEQHLVTTAERIDAVLHMLGYKEPSGNALNLAWKELLKVHPHDDITGCSVDVVHRENEHTLGRVLRWSDALERRGAELLINHFGGRLPDDPRYTFFVYSTDGHSVCKGITVRADFEGHVEWGDIRPPQHYDIVDEEGNSVPFEEVSRGRAVEHPHPVLTLRIYPRLEPLRFHRFFIQPRTSPAVALPLRILENQWVRVKVHTNGTIDLLDKNTKVEWSKLGFFSDQADCGDEYTFSHIAHDREKTFTTQELEPVPLRIGGGLQAVGFSGTMLLPQSSTPAGHSKKQVALPFEIEYRLAPQSRMVECRIQFTNTACDHRLRWNLSIPSSVDCSRAGLKLNEIVRPASAPVTDNKGFRIDPEHPADHYVAIEAGGNGLAVFPQFPCNYEIVNEKQKRLALCILRAIGSLGRSDLLTRAGGAGPETLTPDAQCLRGFDFLFALRPYQVSTERDDLFAESMQWRSLPLCGYVFGFHPDRRDSVPNTAQVEILTPNVVIAALKQSADRVSTILRLYNGNAHACKAQVRIAGVTAAQLTLLNEKEVVGQVTANTQGVLTVSMRPYALCTLSWGSSRGRQKKPIG